MRISHRNTGHAIFPAACRDRFIDDLGFSDTIGIRPAFKIGAPISTTDRLHFSVFHLQFHVFDAALCRNADFIFICKSIVINILCHARIPFPHIAP